MKLEDWCFQLLGCEPSEPICTLCGAAVEPQELGRSLKALQGSSQEDRFRLFNFILQDWRQFGPRACLLYDVNKWLCSKCFNAHMQGVEQLLKEAS